MKKKIKIYLHHEYFEHATVSRIVRFGDIAIRSFFVAPKLIFEGLYLVGIAIVYAIRFPKSTAQWLIMLPSEATHLRQQHHKKSFQKTIGIFALLAILSGFAIHSVGIIASGQNLKERVLGASDEGFKYLQEAQQAFETEDVTRAQNNFAKALQQFEHSEQELASASTILKGLLIAVPQKHDGDRLLQAAQLMTEAAIDGTAVFTISQNLKITPEGIHSSVTDTQFSLLELNRLVNSATNKILQATELLSQVNTTTIPEGKRTAFVQVRDMLTMMQSNMTSLRDVNSIFTSIALGKKNILLIFQNNNELRATGGFIGTIGKAAVSDGAITNLDIRSIYDFDGQMKDWILPPTPLRVTNNRWYMRDSNWFSDFKDSANNIISLYEMEGGETPDMIMAITPDLVIDILKKTGPITLPQYGVTLTPDNFIETIQTSTSVAYSKELNQPKQLLADFFPTLLQQLGNSPEGMVPVIEILQNNLYKKNILLYSRKEELQSKFESFNWAGRIRSSDRDFLSIVSANVSGTKTDNALQKNIELKTTITNDGTIIDTVSYTVTNPLAALDGLRNMSFVRFLVPPGSKLLSTEGFSENSVPTLSDQKYITIPSIEQWDASLSIDELSGTYIGTEAGKTMFGNWMEIKGGESKTVIIKYSLPSKLGSIDRYGMVLQKQPGTGAIPFRYSISYSGREVLWLNKNAAKSNGSESSLSTEGELATDSFFGIVLRKLQ